MALPIMLSQQPACADGILNESAADDDEGYGKTLARHIRLVETLPKGKGWMSEHLLKYKNFWLTPNIALKGTLLAQDHFHPNPNHLLLASFPKSGTTWLRSLMFSIVNRTRFHLSNHPLLTTNPHDCFPFLEVYVCKKTHFPIASNLGRSPSDSYPDLYGTHIPFSLLPESIKVCKMVYVSRDPKDVFVSKWHFMSKLRAKHLPPLSLEEAFELFCDGVSHYGPYWNHVLEYWQASQEHPEKVLFLKYEDIMREPTQQVKILASFIGRPFTAAEEAKGMVEDIVRLCSFEHLSKLDINKASNPRVEIFQMENKHFFRNGVVGDGRKKLTPQMIHRLDRITEEKLHGTGLSFKYDNSDWD